MSYTYDRLLSGVAIDDADMRVRHALSEKGFGVLTEIDVKATMKKKIDVDMDAYRILGACNPNMAHQAIGLEPRIGAMLPCNVILRQVEGGTEVSAIDSGLDGCGRQWRVARRGRAGPRNAAYGD